MTQAYLDAAPSGSALRALLGVGVHPADTADMAAQPSRHAALHDDVRFFASAYLLGLVFFLLLLV